MTGLQHLIRQSDVIPAEVLSQKINIIGAGGIGSHTSVALAKMGFINQTVWDFDEVSIENMNSQGYRFKDIGRPKVEALQDIVFDYSNHRIEIRNEKFEKQKLSGIVISAVDSMAVRKQIWQAVKGSLLVDYLIDPRMSLEYALMYTMNPNDKKDQESYEKTLYSDEGSVQEPCTAKSVMYTTNLISGLVAKAVKNIVIKQQYPRVTQWDIAENNFLSWKGGVDAAQATC